MNDINEEFLDYYFPDDPRFVFGDLGGQLFGDSPLYEDLFGEMSDSEIDACIERMDAEGGGADELVTRIFNQGQEGSCVANACSQAHQIVQALQFGKANVVQLSAISLYKRIGRSPSSGAMVSDGIEEMDTRGILPLDNEANRARFGTIVMPNTGFRTPYPPGWEAVAKYFAGAKWYPTRSVNGIFTALCRQKPVVVGREGHSIVYARPTRLGSNRNRKAKYPNSWSPDWGDEGFGYDTENQIRKSASWAAVLESVVSNPFQVPQPN